MTEPVRIPRNGKTAREIAEKLGVTERTVQRWTSEPKEIYEARVSKRHERIIELREAGKTMQQIADEVDVAVGTVHYAIQQAKKRDAEAPEAMVAASE